MTIYHGVEELIGKTPLMRLDRLSQAEGVRADVLGKVEFFNPAGSIKDRTAYAMVTDAEARGLLKPGATLVEPTSGNTGVALAMLAAAKGYRMILTMPDTMSLERRMLLAAFGAELVLTPGAEGMKGAIAKAIEIAHNTPGSFIPSQFDNPANPRIHEETTGLELWVDTEGRLDVLVSAVGTGGTFSGTARALKARNPELIAIAVEPEGSAVLSGETPGPHKIQGIGAGFVPKTLDTALIDVIKPVSGEDAYRYAKLLARTEGLLCGISSGAALAAAYAFARLPEYADKTFAVILPDTGERYLSAKVYED